MPLLNHSRIFRPLRGGVYVFNPKTDEPGTLGAIATSDGADRWIIGCYHVLGRSNLSAAANGEPIYQPAPGTGSDGMPVAFLDITRCSRQKDFAAAKCTATMSAVPEILGIGPIIAAAKPEIDMKVAKSGMASGVTEGVIQAVNGDDVLIASNSGFPRDYRLTEPGDSGAVWISLDKRAPVAMNLGLGAVGSGTVLAVSMLAVLRGVRLSLLVT